MNILLSQSLKSFETNLLGSNHRIGLLNDAWTGYAHYGHAGTTTGGVPIMLYISLGEFNDNCITDVSGVFNLSKKAEWFADPFVREVIEAVDKSKVIAGEYIESSVLGGIAPERLSTGTKALILMRMRPDRIVYATRCGDNCAEWIVKLSLSQDVHIMLHNCMKFPDEFEAIITETDRRVTSDREFVKEYYRYNG